MPEFNVGNKTYVDLIILSFKVLYKCDAVIQISAQLSGSTTQVCEFLTFKITFLFLFLESVLVLILFIRYNFNGF